MIETRNPARIPELPDVPGPTLVEPRFQEAVPGRSLPRRLLSWAWPTRRKGTALTLGLGLVAMGVAFHPLWLNQTKETIAAEPEKPIDPPKLPAKKDDAKPTDKPLIVEPIMPDLKLPAPVVSETKTDVKLPPPPANLLKPGEAKPAQPIQITPSKTEDKPATPPIDLGSIPPLNLDMPDLSVGEPSKDSPIPAPLDLNKLTDLEPPPSVEKTTITPMNIEPFKLEESPKVETPPIVQIGNEQPAPVGVPKVEPNLPPAATLPEIKPLETPNPEGMVPFPSTTTETPPATPGMMDVPPITPAVSTPPPSIEPVVEQPKPVEPPTEVDVAPMQPILKQPFQVQPEPEARNVAPQPEPKTFDVTPQPEPIAVNTEPKLSEPTTNFDVDIHAVRPSDSYGSLSQRYYGSDRYAEGLQTFNQGLRLMPGVEVKVPPMYILRQRGEVGEPSSIVTTSSTVSESSQRDLTWNSASTNQRLQYVVPHGNMTLWDVAEDRYGDRSAWNKLYAANPQLDPNAPLEAGTVLRLPEPTRQ